MTVRPLTESDLARLREIDSEPDELPSLSDPMTEAALVMLDEKGNPVMACVAVRTVQMYLVASKRQRPFQGSRTLRTMQNVMGEILKQKGYTEAFAFVSNPRFGRALEARFGWLQTKLSWMKRL
jgi:hypothetical protein